MFALRARRIPRLRVPTWALLLVTVLAALVTVCAVIALRYREYVLVREWLAHPIVCAVVTVVLLASTVHRVVPVARVRHVLVALVLVPPTLVLVLLWPLLLLSADDGFDDGLTQRPAPDGRPYSLVVEEGAEMLGEPLWFVSVRTRDGWRSRDWQVACFGEGDPLASAQWAGPDLMRLQTEEGDGTLVRVDPRTGRPEVPAETGSCKDGLGRTDDW